MQTLKPIFIHQFKRTINSDAVNIYHSNPYKKLNEFYDQGISLGTLKIDEYFHDQESIGTIVIQFVSPTTESERKRILKLAEDEYLFNFSEIQQRDIKQLGKQVTDKEMILNPKERNEIDLDKYLLNVNTLINSGYNHIWSINNGSGATQGSIP